jgi:alpha-N-arabinofuranosidase
LIGYDALTSYGSPAYYAQKMFSRNHGDMVLPAVAENLPTREWQPPAGRGGGPPPAPRQVPTLFFNATRDSKSGMIFLKVVNSAGTAQTVRVEIGGIARIDPKGEAVVLSAKNPEDTNSITEPTKIAPVTAPVDRLGADFTRTFPPYSITVLRIKGK